MSTDGTGRKSPLTGFFAAAAGGPADGAGVVVSERPFLGHVSLRGDPGDGGFTSAAEAVLGFRLPTEPNTTVANGGLLALWLMRDVDLETARLPGVASAHFLNHNRTR